MKHNQKKKATKQERKSDKKDLRRTKNITKKLNQQRSQMEPTKTSKLSKGGSSHVRMSPNEYKRILKDSQSLGLSIPDLLKESYFKNPPRKVLVSKDDLIILRKDLNRIGNNLNQVARKLNAGLMHGWSNTLELVLEEFETLKNQIHYGYGIHKS